MEAVLPNELIDAVCGLLGTGDLRRVSCVSRRLRNIAQQRKERRQRWRNLCGGFNDFENTQQPQQPLPLASQASAVHGERRIVVVGGGTYLLGGPVQHFKEVRNAVHTFDLATGAWKRARERPTAPVPHVTEHSLVEHRGQLWCFGGTDRLHYSRVVHRISVSEDGAEVSAQIVAPLALEDTQEFGFPSTPDPRSAHTAAVCGESMLVFGGWNGMETLGDLWAWKFASHRWVEIASSGRMGAPCPRRTHSAVGLDRKMYVFGGFSDNSGAPGESFNDLWCFDVGAQRWTMLPARGDVPSPRGRCAMVADPVRGGVLLFGGWDRTNSFGDLFEYSPRDGRWFRLSTDFESLSGGGVCQHSLLLAGGDRLLSFGGFSTQTASFSNELMELRL